MSNVEVQPSPLFAALFPAADLGHMTSEGALCACDLGDRDHPQDSPFSMTLRTVQFDVQSLSLLLFRGQGLYVKDKRL